MNAQENFDRLAILAKKSAALDAALATVHWDERTQAGSNARECKSTILGALSEVAFTVFVNDEVRDLLAGLTTDGADLLPEQRMLVERLNSCYQRAKMLTPEFVAEQASVISNSNAAWEQARATNDRPLFAPHLQKVLDLTREEAILYGANPDDGDSIYTALLEGYEPGNTTARAREISERVCDWIKEFLPRIKASSIKPDVSVLQGDFDPEQQDQLCRALVTNIGYDLSRGHLAPTTHPFCTNLGPSDVRITTRYPRTTIRSSVFGTLHEAGHAMYDQGTDDTLHWMRPTIFRYSLGLHESQSRMWENMVGRSSSFWEFAYPLLQMAFPKFNEVSFDTYMLAINAVRQSPIRVEADELSYNLHIAFRVLLEIRLMSEDLSVEDLPAEFARMLEEYVGYLPQTLAEGVLQDTHWANGLIGYFVTYMYGNLAAAQLFATFAKACPDYETFFASGEFSVLLDFLREKVHPFGSIKTLDQVLIEVTGESLNPQFWFDYIESKYSELYELS